MERLPGANRSRLRAEPGERHPKPVLVTLMLPTPLHPAVIHFPLVFAFLLPVATIVALWLISRGQPAARTWRPAVIACAVLALSAWAAVQTGEAQEERVEHVVPDSALSTHESNAELFLAASAALFVVTALGLVPGLAGRVARPLSVAGSVALVIVAVRLGDSGGKLVYTHGAAAAYTASSDAGRAAPEGTRSDDDEGRDR